MNYFDFFDIPLSYTIDKEKLKKKYYAFSKQYHPDFFMQADASKQAEILELSSLNNKGYHVLIDDDKRLNYLFECFGLIEEGEKNNLSNDFLLEMMELNEAIMELELEDDPKKRKSIQTQLTENKLALEEQIIEALDGLEGASPEKQKEKLLAAKESYLKKKYLLRISDSLDKFATR